MLISPRWAPLITALGLAACAPDPPPTSPIAPSASGVSVPASAATQPSSANPGHDGGQPCGGLDCRLYRTPEDAFAVILAQNPKVLGIGEAHAQKGTSGIESAAKRFTDRFLPMLKDRASDLVVELMLPPKGCKPAEQEVRVKQQEVTKHQASSNQSEYVTMGDAARKVGVVPDALRPSCEDLEATAKAGDLAIPKMLENIARLAGNKAKELVARNEKLGREGANKVVVLYGGALHNDVAPKPEKASWSFGPELSRSTGGRYIELDVFVPESIQDTDAWRSLPWYPYYDRAAHAGATALFKTGPSSWALVFPQTLPQALPKTQK